MTYIREMKEFLEVCDCIPTIYERKPVRAPGIIKPLTAKERRQIDRLSTERGYRRFVADLMSNL